MTATTRTSGARRWIVSPRFDLALLGVPFLAALAALPTLGAAADVPLWAYLMLIVAFDVSHVWATVYVTYLDSEAFERHRLLFLLPLPIAFVVAYRLHAHSPTLYWTLLAYVAIYHFAQQQWGFVALYKARAGERRRFDYYLDKWSVRVGALGPVLLWHASPARQFDWFNAGESFIATVDPGLKPDIVAVMVAFAVLYVGRQVHLARSTGEFNLGKNLWMGCTWLSWSVGISYADHPLVSAAFLNLFHGIPFLALVWYRCNRRWEGQATPDAPLVVGLSQRRNWPAFYLVVLGLALAEESLWDGLVWKTYLPALLNFEAPSLSATELSFWVALLSLPQILHYYLDAWIWKLDGSNPDLRAALDL